MGVEDGNKFKEKEGETRRRRKEGREKEERTHKRGDTQKKEEKN
jgi:hypothetical protein